MTGDRVEEARPIACRYNLGRSLARAVRVSAAERIGFAIRLQRLTVLIDLVGSDEHHCAHGIDLSGSLEDVCRSDHVAAQSAKRIAIALTDERLRRQMEDNHWL